MKKNRKIRKETEQKKLKMVRVEEQQIINRNTKYRKYRRKINREREKRFNDIKNGIKTLYEFLDTFISQSNKNNFTEVRT